MKTRPMHLIPFGLRHPSFTFAALASLLLACGSADNGGRTEQSLSHRSSECSSAVVSGRGVGPITIGSVADSIPSRCVVLRDGLEQDDEGNSARTIRFLVGRDTVEARTAAGLVSALVIGSGGLSTADGVSVGSNLWNSPSGLGKFRALLANGGLVLLPKDECGLAFELDYELDEEELLADWASRDLERLRDPARVGRIVVSGCHP